MVYCWDSASVISGCDRIGCVTSHFTEMVYVFIYWLIKYSGVRRQKSEGRRQESEFRSQKAEGRSQHLKSKI
ncbi:MAG: hypothetical protein HC903_13975 [Methylacidiphilales bacterium]|nr:hypothetical protein [Candidatus Methylacidiphilales bacterium]